MATILSEIKQENGNKMFTDEQIGKLDELADTLFDNPLFINNIITLMSIMSFEDIFELIKTNKNLDSHMFRTPIFDRPKNIIDNTFFKTLKQPRIITGYYTCTSKKCGSKNVKTRTLQTRSGDESSTDYNTCLDCGNTWSVN